MSGNKIWETIKPTVKEVLLECAIDVLDMTKTALEREISKCNPPTSTARKLKAKQDLADRLKTRTPNDHIYTKPFNPLDYAQKREWYNNGPTCVDTTILPTTVSSVVNSGPKFTVSDHVGSGYGSDGTDKSMADNSLTHAKDYNTTVVPSSTIKAETSGFVNTNI